MRRLLLIICALVAGAMISILTTWACALRSQESSASEWQTANTHFTSFLPPDWLSPPPNDSNGYRVQCRSNVWTGFGATVEVGSADGGWDEEGSDQFVYLGVLRVQQCGWPWRGLECARADASPGGRSCLVGGIEPPDFLHRAFPKRTTRIPPFRPALPLQPLWTGLLLDTFFYTAIIAGLLCAPRAVRQMWRARHSQCISCGYDRTGLAPGTACPECGTVH